MKRWMIWLLILVLALSGCTTDEPNNTVQGTQPGATGQQPTNPPVSLYVSNSALEKQTGGAVQVYACEGGEITGIGTMGSDMVVYTYDGERTTITRVSAQNGTVRASTQRNGRITGSDSSTGAVDNKLAYYDKDRNCYVILDGTFLEIDRVPVAEGMAGLPVVSSDLTTAYYCTGTEIRGLDLHSKIARLVRQLNVQQLQMEGLLMSDTVLQCIVTDADGKRFTAFYSAENGQSLGKDDSLTQIESGKDGYLLRRMDATVEEVLVGGKEGKLQSFFPEDAANELYVLPGISAAAEVGNSTIAVYELAGGNALGKVNLAGISEIRFPVEDPSGEYIWFCATDPQTRENMLCRWDYDAAGADEVVRTGVRHTVQNPDTAGLAECEALAKQIGEKYYVTILLGDLTVEPGDYSFVPEYQVSAYRKALEALDKAMARFPEDFFYIVGTPSETAKLQISLVRRLVPNSYDVPQADGGLQYWIGESAYIALEVGPDVERNFYHELCRAMDTYVYANTSQYDLWSTKNPEGFQYDGNYDVYQTHEGSPYLEGENRAFIDAYSMTYAHEDRATVMEYALLDGCEEYFQSEIMQHKLTVLCRAIRRAFGWRYYEGTFPWEQYLAESQAYVKEK